MNAKNLFFTLVLATFFSGCAELAFNRSFVDEMERDSDGFFIANHDFPVVSGDSGEAYRSSEEIRLRTPASASEREHYSLNDSLDNELTSRESTLSPEDRELYYRVSRFLTNQSEKIYYLKLTRTQRAAYLKSRQIDVPASVRIGSSLSPLERESSRNEEILLGMEKSEVIKSWGRPHRVDVAGDPRSQNERWTFYSNGKAKLIYFEEGRVQGWTLE